MTKPTRDLQQQVNWQHPERKPLLTWDIKARNYNTAIMTGFYIFGLIVFSSMALFFHYIILNNKYSNPTESVIIPAVFFLFMFSFFYPWTHPRKTFVYRFTAQGYEEQSWNDIEKWKTIAIVVGIVLVVAILALASVFPEALLGLLIGPPLMGLFYYRLLMSKSYWDMQKDFSKGAWVWSKFNGIHVYRKRAIIILLYDWDRTKDEGIGRIIKSDVYLFCPADRLDEIIEFIKTHTNELPYKEGYYSILQ